MTDPLDDALTALAHDQMPFTRELGIGIVGGDATAIRARCSWSPERCTPADVLHGGYLMAVADITRPDGKLITRTTQTQAVIELS
ncbi:MAG: hypothetical protein GY724_07465 [Actinomycetia bacterium]|nr:hypothetical protein [Actinomycetes bacterium]MCP4227887.1 hypothetical protein [Actinomycetes bacterium]